MQELKVAFVDDFVVYLSQPIYNLIKKSPLNAWDPDLISNIYQYGAEVVTSSKKSHVALISFPIQISLETIQKYLRCGQFHCKFKSRKYIQDLVEQNTFTLKKIQEELKSCQEIKIIYFENVPKCTDLGIQLVQDYYKDSEDWQFFEDQNYPKKGFQ